jgi:hypothetical protein
VSGSELLVKWFEQGCNTQDCSEGDEGVNVNVSLSPSLQESLVDGNVIASLAVPSAPSSAAGAEVPTEGKLHSRHLSIGLFEICYLIKMCSYFFVQKYTF